MKILRNTFIFLCLISTLVFAFVSCGSKESIRLAADKTTAKHGEVVTFSTTHVTMKGETLTNEATYEITAGADNATLEGNKLTISDTAKDGAVICVVAKMGDLTSNQVNITVDIPENSISISLDRTVANRGDTVNVTVTLTENGETVNADDAELQITKGAEAATLVGTKLKINEDAVNGTEIEVVATYKGLTSNTVKVTVKIPVTAITISAPQSFVPAGSFVTLQTAFTPAGLTNIPVEWLVTEGADLCTVSGNNLMVNAGATEGATIKVKAKFGDVVSNELTFTVGDGAEETYFLYLSQSALTVDRNGATDTLLEVEVLDGDFNPVDGKTVTFELVTGTDLLTLEQNGNLCYFSALKHGDAVLRVSLPGTNVSKTATIKVIVPPDAVKLPDVFVERLGLDYNFSMVKPGEGTPDRLDFSASVFGDGVCTNLKYTFAHEDGTTGDAVAVWGDGKITFKKTGRVTVTVSSDSGSRNETTASYRFQINQGHNVRNYTELKSLLESDSYNGEIVNIVVSEKPTGANGYAYGYDLVPPTALKANAEQTWQEIFWSSTINAYNKNVHINGNGHKIDASQLRAVTQAELDTLAQQGYSFSYVDAILMIAPNAQDPMQVAGKQHSVKIFNFEVVGNTPINFAGDLDGKVPVGSYNTGIYIGSANYDVVYHLEMSNVTASKCHVGLRFRHTISDSTVDDINVYNCFSNGIETEASIITFGDMTFGSCGAAGMEMVPANSNRAGEGFNQPQKITFAGVIDTSANLSKGDSLYLQNFTVPGLGYKVTDIIYGVMQQYPASGSHMMNANGEFAFVTFIFHDAEIGANKSQAAYPAYQNGGIIDATDLPTDGTFDTTHEYIRLEIAIGGNSLGYALLYNHHYGK